MSSISHPSLDPSQALLAISETPGLPDGFLDSFLSLTKPQRNWLIARLNAPSLSEAARQAGVAEQTVYGWRSYIPAFRECERAVIEARGNSTLQLARAIYKAAIPEVAVRQVDQALEDHRGLSDRQLMAQQRAREAVSRGSGLEEAAPSTGEEAAKAMLILLAQLAGRQPRPTIDVALTPRESARASLEALTAPREGEQAPPGE